MKNKGNLIKTLGWEKGLAGLVALPLLVFAGLSLWLWEADRQALAAGQKATTEVAVTAAMAQAIDAFETNAAATIQSFFAVFTEDGEEAARQWLLTSQTLALATAYDLQGERLYPAPAELLLQSEQQQLDLYSIELSRLTEIALRRGGLVWGGGAVSEATSTLLCQKAPTHLVVCFVYRPRALEPLARSVATAMLSEAVESFTIASTQLSLARDTALIQRTFLSPLQGWRVVVDPPPSPGRTLYWLVFGLGPVVAAMITGALVLSAQRRRQVREEQAQVALLAELSHELRTPLANLRLYGELLAMPDVSDEKRGRYSHVVRGEAGRLSVLVDNALACARGEGMTIAAPTLVDPEAVIKTVLDDYAPVLKASGPIKLDLVVGAPVSVSVDVFTRVAINLLENAAKHAPDAEVKVTLCCDENLLVLTVHDQGPGLAPDVADNMFEPFNRGAAEQTGFGLGLAAAHHLVEAAGGQLRHIPTKTGCCFELRLPIHQQTGEGDHAGIGR